MYIEIGIQDKYHHPLKQGHNDVDSLTVRHRLPVLDFGTSRLETSSPAFIRRTFEQWTVEMTLHMSTWGLGERKDNHGGYMLLKKQDIVIKN
eukprot:11809250-Prorocentrum_lima.AAC.1